jgi:hypothetical protein
MSGYIPALADVSRAALPDSRRIRAPAWAALIALVALLAGPALADPPAQPAPADTDIPKMDTVKIETRAALKRQISNYVSSIIVPQMGVSQTRWNDRGHGGHVNYPICVHALGLPPAQEKFMNERLRHIAMDAGALVSDMADCKPANFWVVVTAQPGEVLHELWAKFPQMFDDRHGLGPIRRLIATEQPVRVWYNVLTKQGGFSRLRSDTREVYSVVIAVDSARVTGLTVGQLTDYVAMVGLVRTREGANGADTPTILRLFAAGDDGRPEGLSSWDRAFLKALYNTDQSTVFEFEQIKARLLQDLAVAP